MLFRPFRLALMLAIAFGAGMLYERERAAESCLETAGILQDIVCR
ncbi:hypothetical protein ACRARG_13070 [Pseudooceanicola sp. C21-150M6]